MSRVKLIDDILECPLCQLFPIVEAPKGSGHLACINPNCCYMTHYGWTEEQMREIQAKMESGDQ